MKKQYTVIVNIQHTFKNGIANKYWVCDQIKKVQKEDFWEN